MADDDLLTGLATCLDEQRRSDAVVIAHIAEVDRRKLFRERGYPSMHAYCVAALHLSEAAAFKRIAVGRVAREHPRLLDMIAAGELHLSGATLLAPVLDAGNADRLLDAARHQRKRRIAELVAAERPRPDVPPRLTKLPAALALAPGPVATSAPAAGAPARIEPLAPARYALEITISGQLRDKLGQAQDLLRHAIPDGDVAEILERGLDLLIERARKQKFATTDRPRSAAAPADDAGPHIPAEVRREVAARDGHQCAFVADDGTRCAATAWLEYDHILPRARGGRSTVDNTRLLCRSHNALEAERKLCTWVAAIPAKLERRTAAARPTDATPRAAADASRCADADTSIDPQNLADAHAALVTLGYRATEARAALDRVRATASPATSLEDLLRAALGVLHLPHPSSRSAAPRLREPGPTWCAPPKSPPPATRASSRGYPTTRTLQPRAFRFGSTMAGRVVLAVHPRDRPQPGPAWLASRGV